MPPFLVAGFLFQLSLSQCERFGSDAVPMGNSALAVYRRQGVRQASRGITGANIKLGLVRDTMWTVLWRNGRTTNSDSLTRIAAAVRLRIINYFKYFVILHLLFIVIEIFK